MVLMVYKQANAIPEFVNRGEFHKMNVAFWIESEDYWRLHVGEREKITFPVLRWCREQFGEPFDGRWNHTYDWIAFRDDVDACAFKMRWC